jgi:hypothetical protein
MIHKRGGYAYSRKVVEKSMKPLINTTEKISRHIAILSIAIEGVDIFVSREITWANAANIGLTGLSLGLSFVPGVGPAIVVAAIGVITAADLIVGWTTDSSLSDKIDKPIVKW